MEGNPNPFMTAINPATGEVVKTYTTHSAAEAKQIVDDVAAAQLIWKQVPFAERARLMHNAANVLRCRKQEFANVITEEMGKLLSASIAEVEKSALGCDYYADNAEQMMADEVVPSNASHSFVAYEPIGVVLAVMPWNFPFWQVFRFAAPALMAGNCGLLKHASNVPGSALAIEEVFKEAGFPPNVFRTLMIGSRLVEGVIQHPAVKAVTLTGSEPAGAAVASSAAKCIKKSVLELGGSDPFVVLPDADLSITVPGAVIGRFQNCGQSCIAAKRFVVVGSNDDFVSQFAEKVSQMKVGDPKDPSVQLGPLAMAAYVKDMEDLVSDAVAKGAKLLCGGKAMSGAFYEPTLLDNITPDMSIYYEEAFGPVGIILRAKDEDEAIQIANDTRFGLGGSVWTKDTVKGVALARRIEAGNCFVNSIVMSDPRLPFGGVKASGFGRELAANGLREFVNVKTIYVK